MENFQEINPGKNWAWEIKGKRFQARLTSVTYEILEPDVEINKYWFEFYTEGQTTWKVRVYFSLSNIPQPVFDAAFFKKVSKTLYRQVE